MLDHGNEKDISLILAEPGLSRETKLIWIPLDHLQLRSCQPRRYLLWVSLSKLESWYKCTHSLTTEVTKPPSKVVRTQVTKSRSTEVMTQVKELPPPQYGSDDTGNRLEPVGTGFSWLEQVWSGQNQSEPVRTGQNRFELVGTGLHPRIW